MPGPRPLGGGITLVPSILCSFAALTLPCPSPAVPKLDTALLVTSDFRPVPDHQEVYADAERDTSVIVEVNEMEDVKDDEAASHHWRDYAAAAGADEGDLELEFQQSLTLEDMPNFAGCVSCERAPDLLRDCRRLDSHAGASLPSAASRSRSSLRESWVFSDLPSSRRDRRRRTA